MDRELFADHLERPRGVGAQQTAVHAGSAGGAACGDEIRFRIGFHDDGTLAVGFDASGCGAMTACGSAVVAIADGSAPVAAALVSVDHICDELGGLPGSKLHAAELAVDGFHRALGSAALAGRLGPVRGRRLVAMSGGVDSSVAAVLAGEHGEVVAVTVELWRDPITDAAGSCCSDVAVRRARTFAHGQGIPHFTLDLREEFRKGVVDRWLEGHRKGLTDNPCVQCNGRVRIEPMVDLMAAIGAERLVTGHYARLGEVDDPDGPLLVAGVDSGKDQVYALARVPAALLSVMEFPLGEMSKVEVRELAVRLGLPSAGVPDSQDLCFLAGVGHRRFLEARGGMAATPGPIVDPDGRRLGTHSGHFNHTVGQRRGLGVGGGTPLYVLETDPVGNTVTVGPRRSLGVTEVELDDLDIRRSPDRIDSVQLRHRAAPGRVSRVDVVDGSATVRLFDPVERVAPGQIACLLDGDTVIGCGTVRSCAA